MFPSKKNWEIDCVCCPHESSWSYVRCIMRVIFKQQKQPHITWAYQESWAYLKPLQRVSLFNFAAISLPPYLKQIRSLSSNY